MAAYGAAILGIGVYFARRQRDATDYFLGKHDLPWWAVMLSIVATETSALTVISVPGIAARGDLTFLQLPFGYLLGRVGVALWLLPGYFTGRQETLEGDLKQIYDQLGLEWVAPRSVNIDPGRPDYRDVYGSTTRQRVAEPVPGGGDLRRRVSALPGFGPMKGTTPIAVTTPTISLSEMRRRASLNTQ